jgi:sulfate transport system substrate-binding protein
VFLVLPRRESGPLRSRRRYIGRWLALAAALICAGCTEGPKKAPEPKKALEAVKLFNVSYDPTRQLYEDVNAAFTRRWKAQTGQDVTIRMSHGGSSRQSGAIIQGLEADVVTLALAYDIDAIADATDRIGKDWQSQLPDRSAPYTSTIVFLVRAGNPKDIHDWNDLLKPGVEIVTPNPKTSGGARWNFLAAWAYGRSRGSDEAAETFVRALFGHVSVLDNGGHGATTTFVERGIGDVLIAWESEALATQKEAGPGKFEIIAPSLSILAEPPVALMTKDAAKHGTTKVATAYLRYLYTPEAQEIIARNFFRPRDAEVAARHAADFPRIGLVTVDGEFGGWRNAQARFFDDGALFDQMMSKERR